MVFTNHTVRFKFKGLEGTMIIDLNTTRNLELVVNLKDPRSSTTLFGILNTTQTAMGGLPTRLLPPCVLPTNVSSAQCVSFEQTFFSPCLTWGPSTPGLTLLKVRRPSFSSSSSFLPFIESIIKSQYLTELTQSEEIFFELRACRIFLSCLHSRFIVTPPAASLQPSSHSWTSII